MSPMCRGLNSDDFPQGDLWKSRYDLIKIAKKVVDAIWMRLGMNMQCRLRLADFQFFSKLLQPPKHTLSQIFQIRSAARRLYTKICLQKGLNIVFFAQKTPDFGPRNRLRIWGVPPSPPLRTKFSAKRGLRIWGVPFTDTIRKVVFEVLP